MINLNNAEQLLSNLWVIPEFFTDIAQVRSAYRLPGQAWKTEYPDRILTPWGSNSVLESVLDESLPLMAEITQTGIDKHVCYASLDLGGSQIMMHRLHPDIKCFVQVCTGDKIDPTLNSCFCTDEDFNSNHPADYVDIAEIHHNKIVEIEYKPNTAWILLNSQKTFFGTSNAVPKNHIRETINLHFGSILKTTT